MILMSLNTSQVLTVTVHTNSFTEVKVQLPTPWITMIHSNVNLNLLVFPVATIISVYTTTLSHLIHLMPKDPLSNTEC